VRNHRIFRGRGGGSYYGRLPFASRRATLPSGGPHPRDYSRRLPELQFFQGEEFTHAVSVAGFSDGLGKLGLTGVRLMNPGDQNAARQASKQLFFRRSAWTTGSAGTAHFARPRRNRNPGAMAMFVRAESRAFFLGGG